MCSRARDDAKENFKNRKMCDKFSRRFFRLTIWQFLSRSSSTELQRSRTSQISESLLLSWSSSEWIMEILSRSRQFFSSNSRFQSLITSLKEFPLLKLLSPLSGELEVNSLMASDCISLPSCNNTITLINCRSLRTKTKDFRRFFKIAFTTARFRRKLSSENSRDAFSSLALFYLLRNFLTFLSWKNKREEEFETNIFAFNKSSV